MEPWGNRVKRKFSLTKLLIGTVVILFGVLLVLPYVWDFESYRDRLSQAISNATGMNVVIRGKITGTFVPVPRIEAYDIYLTSDKIDESEAPSLTTVKTIKADLNISNLVFKGQTRINAVTLSNPVMDWLGFRRLYSNWTKEKPQEKNKQAATDIKNIIIRQGEIVSRNATVHTVKNIGDINATITMPSFISAFTLKGDFLADGNRFDFDANFKPGDKGDNDSTWNFYGDGFKITFTGDLSGDEKNQENTLQGQLEGSANDIDFIIQKYVYDYDPRPKKRNKKNKEITDKSSQVPVSFKSDFLYEKKQIRIDNFSITSDALQGSGNFSALINRDIPEVDLSLVIDRIDANKFVFKTPTPSTPTDVVSAETFIEESRETGGLYEKISSAIAKLAPNINMLCDISVKKIAFHDDALENIILNADMFGGDLVIHQLTAHIPGDTVADITGSVTHNNIRPKFTGEILVSGQDLRRLLSWSGIDVSAIPETTLKKFKLNSDITLISNKVNITGADFSVDNIQGSGNVSIREGRETAKITSILKLSNIDFDSYQLNKTLKELVHKYYYGDESDPYSKNFSWLRSYSAYLSMELSLEQFKLGGINFNRISSTFGLTGGSLHIKDLVVDSDPLKFNGNLQMDITGLRPTIDLSITGDRIDTAAFGYKPSKSKNATTLGLTDTPFTFFGLSRFDGDIDVKLKEFIHNPIALQKLDFISSLNEGLMEFKKLDADVVDKGHVTATGSLLMEGLSTLSASFAINNVKLAPLLDVFSNFKAFSGYVSISGSATASGVSPLDWLKNLKSNITFAARAVDIDKFGLHDFIQDGADVTTAAQVDALKTRTMQNGTTQFVGIDGTFQTASGLLDFPNVSLLSARSRGIISGRVDLVNWLLNIVGRFSYFPTNDAKRPINVGFTAVGPVYNPTKTLDASELMSYKGIAVLPQQPAGDSRGRRIR